MESQEARASIETEQEDEHRKKLRKAIADASC